ncbi:hypothetical protein ACH47Z_41495 [Streptomyces sp. NPDC020192]|uniref:hypothetical protein n=1 Tax=Streptomyces sp. NPDC020192 TaxID=3365066 RepID=UPI00379D414E
MASPGGYHLMLATPERSVQHGWWWSEDVARDKFDDWVRLYRRTLSDARVTLSDEDSGVVLDSWPDQR